MYRPLELRIKNFISYEELVYKFPQRPVLLIGENKDDSSQKRNGSGKSALIEAVSLAIVGEGLRKVKEKELIRRGADSCEVEIDLYNKKLGKVLSIKRSLFRKKSSKVEIRYGSQEIRLSSVAEYDAYILNKLELTKDDFFNFFVIKKDEYKPFFVVGDVKKKAIINRFSKADIIDKTKPLIDLEISVLEHSFRELEKKGAYLNGQITLLSEQLSQETPGKHLEVINLEIESLKLEQLGHRDSTSTYLTNKASVETALIVNNKEIAELEILISNTKIAFEVTIKEYTLATERLALVNEKIQTVRHTNALELEVHQKEKVEVQNEVNEHKAFMAQLDAKIRESIECPACHHLFCLNDKEFSIEDAKEAIKELTTFIEALENEVNRIGLNISALIQISEQAIVGLSVQKTQAEADQASVTNLGKQTRVSLDSAQKTWNTLSSDKTLKDTLVINYNKRVELNTSLIADIEKKLEVCLDKLQIIKAKKVDNQKEVALKNLEVDLSKNLAEIDIKRKQVELEKSWVIHFKNFKSFLANQSIGNIQDYTNMYLGKMESNLTVEVDGYRNLSNDVLKEEITTTVIRNGVPAGSYGVFSAGERARIDVACIMSIQHLINLSCKEGGLDLLICDEILDAADSLGIQKIIESISDCSAVIMIVSQNEVMSSICNILTATKESGVTSLSYNF